MVINYNVKLNMLFLVFKNFGLEKARSVQIRIVIGDLR